MRVRRWAAFVLALVMGSALCACSSEREREENLEMEAENRCAWISFADESLPGDTVHEPEGLYFEGTSVLKTVSVLVGDNDRSYTARTLKGYNSSLSFRLSGLEPDSVTFLDIEEVHLRDDDAIAYTVCVNGSEVYSRVYAPSADGLNHAFFDIPASVCGPEGTLDIRIVNKTDSEVRFRRVWAISNPRAYVKQQAIDTRMDVVLMLNQTPTNLNYAYLKSLVDSYRCNDMYNIGLCWEIQYLAWGKEKTEEYLNNVIAASLYTGATLYLGINSWWGGTAIGMDGLGGMWQDVPYQQITYDPINGDGRGNWQLSTPNEWSDTAWLSMNNPHYNEVRLARIKETVAFIQRRTAELAAGGQTLKPIHLYTENEPYYWPINWTHYENEIYPNGIGDFSPYVVRAAAGDGVTLDPTDGLNEAEAFWLYRNLHSYISEVGQAMEEGLGANYIVIKDGVVTLPTEQMINDSYSHSPIQAIYPNWDENRKAWENHVLDSVHFGGEWSVYLDDNLSRGLDYLLSYGSFSNINAERAGFPGGNAGTDFRVLSQCYAYGLEGVIIYNVLADTDQKNVINESRLSQQKMPARSFKETAIFESDFSQKTAFSLSNALVAIEHMRQEGDVAVPTDRDGGALTYRIRKSSKYEDGLRICVDSSLARFGRVEILAGSSPETLAHVETFDEESLSCFISPKYYEGAKDIYVKVRLYNAGLSGAHTVGLAISGVGIYRPAVSAGRTDGSVYTYKENRARCQIIASRADAERLMEKYISAVGSMDEALQNTCFERARALYNDCRYAEAFESASQALSSLLPLRFTVAGYGALEDYPLTLQVESSAKVTVTLKEASDERLLFGMETSSDTDVLVSFRQGTWKLDQLENGDFLALREEGDKGDGEGSAFELKLAQTPSMTHPGQFEARLLAAGENSITVMSQNPSVTDYSNGATFLLTPDVKVYRGADGTDKEEMEAVHPTQLADGDYVQVTLNENGRVSEIYAWYGNLRGQVVSVEEISLEGEMSNACVLIKAADGTVKRFEIGYDCALTFSGATGKLGKLALVGSVGLRPGQTVTVQYCPYAFDGRVRALEISD